MKVKDFMRRSVITASSNDKVGKIVRYIFNLGIAGIPIIENKKLVGIVTEKDILAKLFPSVKDIIEDEIHSTNFEIMETNLHDLLQIPISKIMTTKPYSVTPDTPIMKAQSAMILNNFARIPVVNNKKELIGIISQGDIFRALAGSEIPYDDNEEYDAWLSSHQDLVVPWKQRLSSEIPDLIKIFKKNSVKFVVDIFAGTGEHAFALAELGYNITAVNKYKLMHKKLLDKYNNKNQGIKNLFEPKLGDYSSVLSEYTDEFDVAIFMGNSLAHNPEDYSKILTATYKSLSKKGVIIIQLSNINKILNNNYRRLQNFQIAHSKISNKVEYAFIEFFDNPENNKYININMSILAKRKNRWIQHSINSTRLAYINLNIINRVLENFDFKRIEYFGSKFNEPIFENKFDVNTHDWLNVIAYK